MNKSRLLALAVLVCGCTAAPSEPLAFPGAEGFGKYTTGGRGGRVMIVTNLNDHGPGSLREAVEASGPRIVVFEVDGDIHLETPLRIVNDDIYGIPSKDFHNMGLWAYQLQFPDIMTGNTMTVRDIRNSDYDCFRLKDE